MADVITVDARGLSCPQPVILAKKAIEANPEAAFEVLVDNGAAKENVSRLAINKGYTVTVADKDDDYVLSITK